MNTLYRNNDIVLDRYIILQKIGQGGTATTYLAKDLQTQEQVAIKVLSLQKIDDWKKIELFDREAKILQQLNHPAIPKYIDYFQIETENDNLFYIIQQLAPGKSLFNLIEEGWQPDETEVTHIASQILEILIYLQQLVPPVIHRDIKPQNIICSDRGEIFLVDFGAVRDTYHHTVMGSTVVGTYGYMAPEQFRGQAFLSTDLYGLGTTLLFLLTRQLPSELPQRKLKINFRDRVNISSEFANWIVSLIEPSHEDRFPSADAALAVLQGEKPLSNYIRRKPPEYTLVSLNKTQEQLVITIPPAIFYKRRDRLLFSSTIVWYLALIFIISGALASLSFSEIYIWFVVYACCLVIEIFASDTFLKISRPIQFFILFLYHFRLNNYNMSFAILRIVRDFITLNVNDMILGFPILSLSNLPAVILISYLFLFVDLFLVSKTKISLIRNLFWTTYIKIDRQQVKISRKLAGIKFNDFTCSTKDLKISRSSNLFLSLFSGDRSIASQTKRDKSQTMRDKQPSDRDKLQRKKYQFGGLLTKAEKLWLIEEIEFMKKNYLENKQ